MLVVVGVVGYLIGLAIGVSWHIQPLAVPIFIAIAIALCLYGLAHVWAFDEGAALSLGLDLIASIPAGLAGAIAVLATPVASVLAYLIVWGWCFVRMARRFNVQRYSRRGEGRTFPSA